MSKLFYDHLIVIEEIIAVLDCHDISEKDRAHILELIDQAIHHHVLDIILQHLPEDHHEHFLTLFHKAPHSHTLLVFLKHHAPDIEEKIKKAIEEVKKELVGEIKKHSTT